MSEKQLVTLDVIKARLVMFYEEDCFVDVPTLIDGLTIDEVAQEMTDTFESPFDTPEDFLLSPSEREEERLWATPGEIDAYIERSLQNKEVAYA